MKLPFTAKRTRYPGAYDVAPVEDDQDPIDAVVAAIVDDIGTSLEVTISGVTMHLAAWRDPEHWDDDWRKVCGDEDPAEFVAELVDAACRDSEGTG